MKKLGKKLSFLTKIMLVIGLLISNLSSLSVVFAYEATGAVQIAVVDETGKVTAKKKGSTIIELRIAGSNVMASINVTVNSEFIIENRQLKGYKGFGGDIVIPDDEGVYYINAFAFCLYTTDPEIKVDETLNNTVEIIKKKIITNFSNII